MQKEVPNNEDEFNLVDLFTLLWSQKTTIIIFMIVCSAIGAFISTTLPKIYAAEITLKQKSQYLPLEGEDIIYKYEELFFDETHFNNWVRTTKNNPLTTSQALDGVTSFANTFDSFLDKEKLEMRATSRRLFLKYKFHDEAQSQDLLSYLSFTSSSLSSQLAEEIETELSSYRETITRLKDQSHYERDPMALGFNAIQQFSLKRIVFKKLMNGDNVFFISTPRPPVLVSNHPIKIWLGSTGIGLAIGCFAVVILSIIKTKKQKDEAKG